MQIAIQLTRRVAQQFPQNQHPLADISTKWLHQLPGLKTGEKILRDAILAQVRFTTSCLYKRSLAPPTVSAAAVTDPATESQSIHVLPRFACFLGRNTCR